MITVLCVQENSNYYKIPGLDIWDIKRDAYNYKGNNPIIAHPPCQQWSRLKGLARMNNREKELAWFCLEMVNKNGGILEHPKGSSFFKEAGINMGKVMLVRQSWWGFPAEKETLLYFNQVEPLATPTNYNRPYLTVEDIDKKDRSLMPKIFCEYLINCIKLSKIYKL